MGTGVRSFNGGTGGFDGSLRGSGSLSRTWMSESVSDASAEAFSPSSDSSSEMITVLLLAAFSAGYLDGE